MPTWTRQSGARGALTPRQRALRVAAATAALLLVPALAMQFTPQVDWGPGDFVVAAVLLACAGAGLEVTAAGVRHAGRRLWIAAGIVAALLLAWAELAVGIFH